MDHPKKNTNRTQHRPVNNLNNLHNRNLERTRRKLHSYRKTTKRNNSALSPPSIVETNNGIHVTNSKSIPFTFSPNMTYTNKDVTPISNKIENLMVDLRNSMGSNPGINKIFTSMQGLLQKLKSYKQKQTNQQNNVTPSSPRNSFNMYIKPSLEIKKVFNNTLSKANYKLEIKNALNNIFRNNKTRIVRGYKKSYEELIDIFKLHNYSDFISNTYVDENGLNHISYSFFITDIYNKKMLIDIDYCVSTNNMTLNVHMGSSSVPMYRLTTKGFYINSLTLKNPNNGSKIYII